jgi:hypothetical protein
MSSLGVAPALEAVIPVIKKFKPDPAFQGETSDEVEAAWKEVLERRYTPLLRHHT